MVPFGLQNFLNKSTVVRSQPYVFESAILLRPPRPEGRNYPSFWGAARRADRRAAEGQWLHPKMKGNSMPKGGPQENCRFKNIGLRAHCSALIPGSSGAQTVPLIVRGSDSPLRRAASIPWSVSLEKEDAPRCRTFRKFWSPNGTIYS